MKTHPSSPSESRALPQAAHTPGPWRTQGFTVYAPSEKKSFGGPIREYLCPVCCMEPGETDGPEYSDAAHGSDYNERLPGDAEAHANARLIAAAPELLAALIAIKSDYEELARNHADAWHEGEVLNHQLFNDKARAAIAKAKGVQS